MMNWKAFLPQVVFGQWFTTATETLTGLLVVSGPVTPLPRQFCPGPDQGVASTPAGIAFLTPW